jgi:hypothetical protein
MSYADVNGVSLYYEEHRELLPGRFLTSPERSGDRSAAARQLVSGAG